jgi:signal peptidase I
VTENPEQFAAQPAPEPQVTGPNPAMEMAEVGPAMPPAAPGISEPTHEPRAEKSHEGWLAGLQSLLLTLSVAVFVITFIAQAFEIPSESMEKTLLIGDYLLVDKTHYGPGGIWAPVLPYRKVKRGDIVVFRYPVHPTEHFVKRVVGVPGDRVRLVHKHVYINGVLQSEPYVITTERFPDSFRDNFPNGDSASSHIALRWYSQLNRLIEDGQLIVPAHSYFVLGDNRDQSLDSRYWGFVPEENIIGRPMVIYWSMQMQALDDRDELPRALSDKLSTLRATLNSALHGIRPGRILHVPR